MKFCAELLNLKRQKIFVLEIFLWDCSERDAKVLESKPVIVGKNLMFWCKVLRVLRQEDLLTLNQNTKTYGIDVK